MDLTKKLKSVDGQLFSEMTIDKNNNYVLIITPNGIKNAMMSVVE